MHGSSKLGPMVECTVRSDVPPLKFAYFETLTELKIHYAYNHG